MAKTALITGASRGIGSMCARSLSAGGYDVVINYRRSGAQAQSLARELGGTAVMADVSDPAQVREMIERTRPDVLVCNAGESLFGLLQDVTDEQWRHVFDVNVGGVINVCRAAIPQMVQNGWGRIITISSVWGVVGASCEAAYSASKAAVIGLTRSLAKELGPSGITANCVAPGVIATQMNDCHSAETLAALKSETPLGRIGTAQDVAACVSFLASERAGFITGQVIGVDGGFGL